MRISASNPSQHSAVVHPTQKTPPCSTVTQVFLKVIASLAIGVAVGAGIGFAIGFIAAGAVIGGIVGLVAMAILTKACSKKQPSEIPQQITQPIISPSPVPIPLPVKPGTQGDSPSPTPVEERPIDIGCFSQLKEQFKNNSTAIKAIDAASKILSRDVIRFKQSFDNHKLHHDITIITDEIKKRADLKKTWSAFLESQNGRQVIYPDNFMTNLDFSRQINRLNNQTSNITIHKTDPHSDTIGQELDRIIELSRECFGTYEEFSKGEIHEFLKNPNNGCFIAKDDKQKMVGFIWFVKGFFKGQPNVIQIGDIGRSANACRMGIGEMLMEAFLQEQSNKQPSLQLFVRMSNQPAISLYEKFGFVIADEEPYFQYPIENRYTMRMDWNKYQQRKIA